MVTSFPFYIVLYEYGIKTENIDIIKEWLECPYRRIHEQDIRLMHRYIKLKGKEHPISQLLNVVTHKPRSHITVNEYNNPVRFVFNTHIYTWTDVGIKVDYSECNKEVNMFYVNYKHRIRVPSFNEQITGLAGLYLARDLLKKGSNYPIPEALLSLARTFKYAEFWSYTECAFFKNLPPMYAAKRSPMKIIPIPGYPGCYTIKRSGQPVAYIQVIDNTVVTNLVAHPLEGRVQVDLLDHGYVFLKTKDMSLE